MYPNYNRNNIPPNYNQSYGQPYYAPVRPLNPAHREKAIIRKSGNSIGAAILIPMGVIYAITYILRIVIRSVEDPSFFLSPEFDIIFQIIFSTIMFVPPFIIVARCGGFRLNDLFVRKKLPVSDTAWFVCAGMLACMAANIFTNIVVTALEYMGFKTSYGSISLPESVFGQIVWVLTMSLLPAIVEEFALRVVVLGTIRRFGDKFAIFASATIFALMHGNFVQIPFTFILGVVFAYITVITGSVIPAIIIHFINNLFSCVSELLGIYCGEIIAMIVLNVIFALFIGSGVLGCHFLNQKGYFKRKLYKPQWMLKEGQAFATFFFTSPCLLIPLVIYAAEAAMLLIAL